MFTGIIERSCSVRAIEPRAGSSRLRVERRPATIMTGGADPSNARGFSGDPGWDDLQVGESIAVDGCCLTLVQFDQEALSFDIIEESLGKTTLGGRRPGARLNLERSLRLGDRLGGHLVSGHIDGTGVVAEVRADAEETRITIEVPVEVPVRVVHKGSIAIDGVSLTVASVDGARFTVALIPHTLEVTNLGERKVGDRVNLEMDQIGRWVDSLLAERGFGPPAVGGV